VGHRREEQSNDGQIERLDLRGLAATRRVERRLVEVRGLGERVRMGAHGQNGVGVDGARHHGDPVATGDEILRDAEQWADVARGRQ
jgi:hypothetical protein